MQSVLRSVARALICLGAAATNAHADSATFGVISQRSAKLTAEYWNPILKFVGDKAGIPLALKVSLSGSEHAVMVTRGEADFIYSNHHFAPGKDVAGYRVIARPAGQPITGQIVVLANSPHKTLTDLQGKEVAFPSRVAFVGYSVPLDTLRRGGVEVTAAFAGNQEGAMAQLKVGRVAAAGVNSDVMRSYAKREGFDYRALWTSEPYQGIPIAAHPRVARADAERVRDAFVAMATDAEGMKVLTASADLIKLTPPFGYVRATDADYENIRRFYKNAVPGKDQ